MQMNRIDYDKVRTWIYQNARPLELFKWIYYFESGNKNNALAVLQTYQNADGGFGNKLEPDSWNPASTPYTTSFAIDYIGSLGGDVTNKGKYIIKNVLRYLERTKTFENGKWPAVIPSNNHYPRAPWWTYSETANEQFGYNPTAKLAGFILCYGEQGSSIVLQAKRITHDAFETYLSGKNPDGTLYRESNREGELTYFSYLISCVENAGLSSEFPVGEMKIAITKNVSESLWNNQSKWDQYTFRPSDIIHSTSSFLYKANREIVLKEVEYLLNHKNEDGVWEIPWTWVKYRSEFAIVKTWWKSVKAIDYMLFIKTFGEI